MKNPRTTPILLLLLLLTLAASIASLDGRGRVNPPAAFAQKRDDAPGRPGGDADGSFPVTDFDAPAPSEPKARAERMKKSGRHDKKNFVSKDPSPHVSESARILEGAYVPAIPSEQSDLIVTGEILGAETYLSGDKTGIYTELTVRVDEVLKHKGAPAPAAGDKITVEREGGHVRYRNGHKRLYRIMEQGMPRVGGGYVLFLSAVGEGGEYRLVTGYELLAEGVAPVDSSKQFAEYGGYATAAFLEAVRASISKTY